MSGRAIALRWSARSGPTPCIRKGTLTLELMLVFPILFALLLAMIQLGMTQYARQQLLAASREGCRVAALGGDQVDVEAMAKKCLGTGKLGESEVVLTDEGGAPIPGGSAVPSGDLIMVWVRIPHAYVVPDLLRFIGYSHKTDELVGRTAMRRE